MKTFHGMAIHDRTQCAIFRVPTKERGDLFMQIHDQGDDVSVVDVDAKRLLFLWRSPDSSFNKFGYKRPDDWWLTPGRRRTEEMFAASETHPFPMPYISCIEYSHAEKILRTRLNHAAEWTGKPPIFNTPVLRGAALLLRESVTQMLWLLAPGSSSSHFPCVCPAGSGSDVAQARGREWRSFPDDWRDIPFDGRLAGSLANTYAGRRPCLKSPRNMRCGSSQLSA